MKIVVLVIASVVPSERGGICTHHHKSAPRPKPTENDEDVIPDRSRSPGVHRMLYPRVS